MSREADKRAKVAPPRVANEVRMSNFMRQTGLRSGPHGAKQRRLLERKTKGGRR